MNGENGRGRGFKSLPAHQLLGSKPLHNFSNLIPLFNVKHAVADIGYGTVQVSELQKKFGHRVTGCQYVRRPELPLEKKEKDEFGNKIA